MYTDSEESSSQYSLTLGHFQDAPTFVHVTDSMQYRTIAANFSQLDADFFP